MNHLRDREWKLKYTPDDGDLVAELYVPALGAALRYDRLTGYFNAWALTLAARGVERLVARGGRMRLVVGCTLNPPEVEAIEKGMDLRTAVAAHLGETPLLPSDLPGRNALELLAWMVAHEFLDIRLAIPCDAKKRPITSVGIFHEKSGIVVDEVGDKIAFNGSLNETAAGWTQNWESLHVFTSWIDAARVAGEELNFQRLWQNQSKHAMTLEVPEAVRRDLLRFLPESDKPALLRDIHVPRPIRQPGTDTDVEPDPEGMAVIPLVSKEERRKEVWRFIHSAPSFPVGGDRVGEATAAILPWAHQLRAFHRMLMPWLHENRPPKLLIADEVGLGKTIQAGLLLRQAWLCGKARRILILAPAGVCSQWQLELREKFNLHWPLYDGQNLVRIRSNALGGRTEQEVSRRDWHKEPCVLVSSHLLRRQERQHEVLEAAEPWDLIILDEAHHARRRSGIAAGENRPNSLLRLMQGLRHRTSGLVMLTATPMQVHPTEVWDLLDLLGMPREWTSQAFLKFFADLGNGDISAEALERFAVLFQAMETAFKPADVDEVLASGAEHSVVAKKILKALRDPRPSAPARKMLDAKERAVALKVFKKHSPIAHLISRHSRDLLRRYHKAGKLQVPIADRKAEDRLMQLSPAERLIYDEVERYIANTYNRATAKERSAVGFVMTIYRRRLASSFQALRCTLESHLAAIEKKAGPIPSSMEEEDEDTISLLTDLDTDEAREKERAVLVFEERGVIKDLLRKIAQLPIDTKASRLVEEISSLREAGYSQVIVFTQYTDTLEFLRDVITSNQDFRVMSYSGRGGEIRNNDGSWTTISRDETKRRFREGQADVLLCTDAAAEGLNFQFCGALINFDMPWNPMRVEQRIGRVDRLGQKYPIIRIINLHYLGTVETDVYLALRGRIRSFEMVVGKLQPILSEVPQMIARRILQGQTQGASHDDQSAIQQELAHLEEENRATLDLDDQDEPDLTDLPRVPAALTLAELATVLDYPELIDHGDIASRLSEKEYRYLLAEGSKEVRVTFDPEFYEQNSESVELWSPGSPVFPSKPRGFEPMVQDGSKRLSDYFGS